MPSEVPRLATDLPVKVFPGVWNLLSFLRVLSQDGSPSLPLLSLFLSFIFFPTSFEDNGLLFWVPDVLCRHSEVVLRNLLSVQMFFDEFVREKVVSPSYSSAILGLPLRFLSLANLGTNPSPAIHLVCNIGASSVLASASLSVKQE